MALAYGPLSPGSSWVLACFEGYKTRLARSAKYMKQPSVIVTSSRQVSAWVICSCEPRPGVRLPSGGRLWGLFFFYGVKESLTSSLKRQANCLLFWRYNLLKSSIFIEDWIIMGKILDHVLKLLILTEKVRFDVCPAWERLIHLTSIQVPWGVYECLLVNQFNVCHQ